MEACIIVTYRCNAKCSMCHTWRYPSRYEDEFNYQLLDKLPQNLDFVNITGGEPFLRNDLREITEIALSKSPRVVISSNGYLTDEILDFADQFRNRVGFRISIEGTRDTNDQLRGLEGGYDHAINTLMGLNRKGIKDIGLGMTVSDRNAADLLKMFQLTDQKGMEFATAVTHNSYYFHKHDNSIEKPSTVAKELENVAIALLKTNKPKNWFRAYFNMGLANKIMGQKRPLPCEVGSGLFFLDPLGRVLPCNGSEHPMVMGNLNEQSFEEIWTSQQADEIRMQVAACTRECWMVGSASPAMKKQLRTPLKWVLKHKLKMLFTGQEKIRLDSLVD